MTRYGTRSTAAKRPTNNTDFSVGQDPSKRTRFSPRTSLYCTEVGLSDPGINLQCAGCSKYLGIMLDKRKERCEYVHYSYLCCQPWKDAYRFAPNRTAAELSWCEKVAVFFETDRNTILPVDIEEMENQGDASQDECSNDQQKEPDDEREATFEDWPVSCFGKKFTVKRVPRTHCVVLKSEFEKWRSKSETPSSPQLISTLAPVSPAEEPSQETSATSGYSKLEDRVVGDKVQYIVKDVPVAKYDLISHGRRGQLEQAKRFEDALDEKLKKGCYDGTEETDMIFAAFAAAHLNISPVALEQIIALSRYTLFLACTDPAKRKYDLDHFIKMKTRKRNPLQPRMRLNSATWRWLNWNSLCCAMHQVPPTNSSMPC